MSLGGSSFNGDTKYSVKSPRERMERRLTVEQRDVRGGGSGHTRGRWMQRAGTGLGGEQSTDEACTLSRSEG